MALLKDEKKPEIKIEAPKSVEEAEEEAEKEAKSKELVSKLLIDPNQNIRIVSESKDETLARNIIKYAMPIIIIACLILLLLVWNKKQKEASQKTSVFTGNLTETTLVSSTTKFRRDGNEEEFKNFIKNINHGNFIDVSELANLEFEGTSIVKYNYDKLKREESLDSSINLAYEDELVSVNTSGHVIINGEFREYKTGVVLINSETNVTAYIINEDRHLSRASAQGLEEVDKKVITDIYYNSRYHIVILFYADYKTRILEGLDFKKLY